VKMENSDWRMENVRMEIYSLLWHHSYGRISALWVPYYHRRSSTRERTRTSNLTRTTQSTTLWQTFSTLTHCSLGSLAPHDRQSGRPTRAARRSPHTRAPPRLIAHPSLRLTDYEVHTRLCRRIYTCLLVHARPFSHTHSPHAASQTTHRP
jgi:hypothetical protein